MKIVTLGMWALPRNGRGDIAATRQLTGHGRIQMDALGKLTHAGAGGALHLRHPSMFRGPFQCDSLHPAGGEAQVDERLGADRTRHQIVVCADGRGALKAGIQIAVPVADVLLPAREIAAAFLAIFLSLKHIETVDRMHGEVDRATGAQGLEALRGMEAAHRNERGQFFQAIEMIPLRFAGGIGKAAFDRLYHEIVCDRTLCAPAFLVDVQSLCDLNFAI